ncbi:hypothetical protein GLOTRDRAFT_125129 [Gloeophyllum trabeum ATCC 11539]|uniref:Uncharacterized protein n=1 Tax=Gloeophyllum trabeum (strain ATCC 11539 / FP-39264 / Madison 617) TaxID=670483 RepID=S7QFZ6_GLOTA|nr:uncharacterized protein GLOTRDRAFT_125129 [Gloeophyllum trabeum ATCC 11539]EPQ58801.1 hypothetical protein GLOTRDRAFT_125129 [Gloeophyllum trabeum ATCC 11539]
MQLAVVSMPSRRKGSVLLTSHFELAYLIQTSLTPDLLHQLHKGLFKDFIVDWCLHISKKGDLDKHFEAMDQLSWLATFQEWNITGLSMDWHRVQGDGESTHRPAIWCNTLDALQAALQEFHDNKEIFITLEAREHFNLPKLHAMQHYIDSIRSRGSPNGFNTELPERLHINYAKDAYRASNKCDYVQQMTKWLDHNEEDDDDDDDDEGDGGEESISDPEEVEEEEGRMWLPRKPPHPSMLVPDIISNHQAQDFLPALSNYLKETCLWIVSGQHQQDPVGLAEGKLLHTFIQSLSKQKE